MKIRQATQSDLQDIVTLHVESWQDAYSDVMPAEFLAGKISREFARHWHEAEIRDGDLVLVAEEDIFGYPVPSRKIEWDDLAQICENQ